MKIYWSANNVTELDGLDASEKKTLFKETIKQGRSRLGTPKLLLSIIPIFIIAFLLVVFSPLKGLLGGILTGAIVGLSAAIFVQSPVVEKGREWLREQGYLKK